MKFLPGQNVTILDVAGYDTSGEVLFFGDKYVTIKEDGHGITHVVLCHIVQWWFNYEDGPDVDPRLLRPRMGS
jgi:hypothetical protein